MTRFVVDFDGTIVDPWTRFHRAFLEAGGVDGVDLESYRDAKRKLVRDEEVFEAFGQPMPAGYRAEKRRLLESPRLLDLDTLLVDAGLLVKWFSDMGCIILTKREDPAALFAEMDRLGIGSLRGSCRVLRPSSGMTKREWVSDNRAELDEGGFAVVGDSLEDMQASALPGARALFVRSGLHSEARVSTCARVDRSFEDLAEVIDDSYRRDVTGD